MSVPVHVQYFLLTTASMCCGLAGRVMWTNTVAQFHPGLVVGPLGNGNGILGPRVYMATNTVYLIDAIAPLRAYDVVANVHHLFNFNAVPQNFGVFAPPFVRNTPANIVNVSAMWDARGTYQNFHRARMVMGSIYNRVNINPGGNPMIVPVPGTFDLQVL